mmetsp:Transcript_68447/g.79728  ORF Transcript_68447/g.79728 Transcript_68447/m.79728 type:complete len:222 (+) Transcript_68447:42-707(+)
MDRTETKSIQQKLAQSRSVWMTSQKGRFLSNLYTVLENPEYNEIICWSTDGRVILIINEEKLEATVSRMFEDCPTLISFYRRLESCFFAEVYDGEYNGNAFEHLHFTRDNRPNFKKFVKEMKRNVLDHSFDSTSTETDEECESPTKKIIKKDSKAYTYVNKQNCDQVLVSENTRAEFARLNKVLCKLQADILLEQKTRQALRMSILGCFLKKNLNSGDECL